MRFVSAVCAALALALLSPLAVLAQPAAPPPSLSVPRLINISGVFQPADGQPPAPVEVVTLSIYAEQDGGVPLWQEMQKVTPDKTGRFTVLLGATHPDGLPPEVFASGEARWMGMLFARPGEVERARVRITSVPYALKASDAETLGGLPASAYQLASAAEEERQRAADAKSKAEAAVDEPVAADLVLAGTTNFLAKYVNAADVGNSGVFETGGRVGMGTGAITPFDRLHLRFNDTGGAITGLAVQNMGNTAGRTPACSSTTRTAKLAQFQGFNNFTHEYRINNIATTPSINFMTSSLSRFMVASNGNIGIGTTTPSALLEVSNAVPGGPANMWMTSYTNAINPYYSARRARGTFAAPAAVQTGDGLAGFYGTGRGTSAFGNTFAGGMTVQAAQNWTNTAQGTALTFTTTSIDTTTAATRMTLASNGNLGIGTTAPSEAVEAVREGANGAGFLATSYGAEETNGGLGFFMRNARGTRAAPAAVQLGDSLGTSSSAATVRTASATTLPRAWARSQAKTGLTRRKAPASTLRPRRSGRTRRKLMWHSSPAATSALEYSTISRQLPTSCRCSATSASAPPAPTAVSRTSTGPLTGSCSSDRRYKKDITPFGPALGPAHGVAAGALLLALDRVSLAEFRQRPFLRAIAQEVEHVLPDLVVTGADGFKTVDYSKLPLLTIQAVKELKAENDTLKQRRRTACNRVAELERVVAEVLATSARR